MTHSHRQPLFDAGTVTTTPAALQVLDASGEEREDFLDRHVSGDWGCLLEEGRRRNDQALATGQQIVSEYRTGSGAKIRILTEAADEAGIRPSTAILLPSEMPRTIATEFRDAADIRLRDDDEPVLSNSTGDSPSLTLDGIVVM
jgi:hypothetical protein